ncbi:MAG: penicillin-binding protein, partial [Candidatus Dormibacteraeota bacterium]|nr:penicillin-binding protein [Candidatus Dormibacteraeota bacterium]MBO0760713.1 penicillin-binding protein [Candidatus Dormibacteraeota bacterium]
MRGPGRGEGRRQWRRLLGVGLLAAIIVVASMLGYVLWTVRDLPDPGETPNFARSIQIYDRNGVQISNLSSSGAFYQQKKLTEISPWAAKATLAAEDRTFYQHGPLDYGAIIRSAGRDAVKGGYTEGASTITQQVVTISVLNKADRTPLRKMQEAVLATAMERKYSKDQILEMYLNRVFYGHNAYGIGAASKVFFNEDAKDLTPGQSAFLAGIINGPGYYDPQTQYERAKSRQAYVLDGMVKMGALTQQQAQQAAQENIAAELKFTPLSTSSIAPHFASYIEGQLENQLGANAVQQGAFRVYTTLDSGLQQKATQAVQKGVASLKGDRVNNGTLLAADPKTGEILAWVGSADYYNTQIGGQFDIVANGRRQPGSSFKVYTYEAALKDHKVNLSTVVPDTPYTYPGGDQPVLDWDNSYKGDISIRTALVQSRNVPAVKVGQMEGTQNVINLAKQMGITSPLDNVPSLAIGSSPITMLENVQGYQVFANQGTKVPLHGITKVTDASGKPIALPSQPAPQQVLTPAQSYLISDVLKNYNNQWDLGWNRQMAGKSGTTGGAELNQHPDAWMMAYNPNIVVGTWAGNTGSNGTGTSVSAFGTDVGSSIARTFINGLPTQFNGWYSQPSGLTRGGSCGAGSDLMLTDGATTNCPVPAKTPPPTTAPRPQPVTPAAPATPNAPAPPP